MIEIDENLTISRYIDLFKLLDFVQFNRLYFRQVDKYDDMFEGSFPKKIYDIAKKITGTDCNGVPSNKEIIENTKLIRQSTYVNCWTVSNPESMAMWNLYAGKNGLAIQTTASVFMNELAEAPSRSNERTDRIIKLFIKLRASQISYIDHLDMDDVSDIRDIMNFPIVFKNIGYSFEKEIRFFYDMRQQSSEKLHEQFGDGFFLNNVDAKKIIEKILVSPSAEHGFFDNIKKILSNYGLDDRVEWSSLRHPPYNEAEFK